MKRSILLAALLPLAVLTARCTSAPAEDRPPGAINAAAAPFTLTAVATFEEPWAIAFLPGTRQALITERGGKLKLWEDGGPVSDVGGVPAVADGGQGGLGDVAVSPRFSEDRLIYLSWAEHGNGDTRGAVAGRARLAPEGPPRLQDMDVFWRQSPKVAGRGHFSHRFAMSPDGDELYVASGDRQKMAPAQDPASDLGKIFRFGIGNPGRVTDVRDMVSLGHRNILGLDFDAQGRLWALEHGPAGGDELNLVRPGANYGWPIVSQGDHYDGRKIPRHAARAEFAAPAISWNPVIAPGGMVFYSGNRFPEWRGQLLIAGMGFPGLVRVAIEGTSAREVARYDLGTRIRAIAAREDGSIWLLEDGAGGRLLRLDPRVTKDGLVNRVDKRASPP